MSDSVSRARRVVVGTRWCRSGTDDCLPGRRLCWANIRPRDWWFDLINESLEGYTIDRASAGPCGRRFCAAASDGPSDTGGSRAERPLPRFGSATSSPVRDLGERIPADGKVVSGSSAVDQSAFTGESLPIDKSAGDKVFAGTLNQYGSLTVVAEQIGVKMLARQIWSDRRRLARRHWKRIVDKLARWFLPAVLLAAFVTLIGWRIGTGSWQKGVMPPLSVLVVACPVRWCWQRRQR